MSSMSPPEVDECFRGHSDDKREEDDDDDGEDEGIDCKDSNSNGREDHNNDDDLAHPTSASSLLLSKDEDEEEDGDDDDDDDKFSADAPPAAAFSSSSSSCSDGDVLIGPDLNPTRSALDRKLYRQIILRKNGLRAILISDTVAMEGQGADRTGVDGDTDDDDDDDENDTDDADEEIDENEDRDDDDDDDDDDHNDKDENDDDDDDDSDSFYEKENDGICDENDDPHRHDKDDNSGGGGIRHAAAALAVGAGSYHDPHVAPGLAHFLEHMLFMGTDKYPTENAYDSFLSRVGGSNNAYTEMERTVFHFEVPQERLFRVLDMFAQFFVAPLLKEEAAMRELNAIESEFQLSRNADECRLQELMCYTGRMMGGTDTADDVDHDDRHPFGKFSWGNMQSLKEIPEMNGVDVMAELRKFYNQYYYAGNMRLVVIGAYTLDELQDQVVRCFSSVPPLPRISSPLDTIRINPGTWDEECTSPLRRFGPPFDPSSLGKVYRVIPVRDRHNLHITWQIPPQKDRWKTKPCDYIAHLLGHEAGGSLLSALKSRSWATTCYAGVGASGYESASSHALFTLAFTLSEEGVSNWADIVTEVFRYIGMLRFHCSSPDGLPSWIYEELKAIQDVAYKYEDEKIPDVLVEDIVEDLMSGVPPERVLDGNALLFEHDMDEIKRLLDEYLTPRNCRMDLMSSTFGRESDENVTLSCPSGICEDLHGLTLEEIDLQKEPMFETKFWVRPVCRDVLDDWTRCASPQLPPPSSPLRLPPVNPFVPTKFDIKPLPPPDDDEQQNHHPLLRCSLEVYPQIKNVESCHTAKVIKYEKANNSTLLLYSDGSEKWHRLDEAHDGSIAVAVAIAERDSEGSFDDYTVKFKVVSVPNVDGESDADDAEEKNDSLVNGHVDFPTIPMPSPESHLPRLISSTENVKLWHMQDRKFQRPIAELRVRFVCAEANMTPLHRACADLFASLCRDAATETSYLAEVCELGSSLVATDLGFTLRVNGFDHRLLNLARYFLELIFSFRDGGDELLPAVVKPGRFEACLEVLLRQYGNAGMRASGFASDIRLMCIMPKLRSASVKAESLRGVTIPTFMSTVQSLLNDVTIEALFAGNVTESDAREAADLLLSTLNRPARTDIVPSGERPKLRVLKVPSNITNHVLVAPTRDPSENNTAIEVYFQIGWDEFSARVLIDLLAHIMYEPLFDQLRTKEQIGYDVSVGQRWTHGVMGMSFKFVTSSHSANEVSDRLDQFLKEFRLELSNMEQDIFNDHVVGVAKNKLHMYNSLEEECNNMWGEICEGRYDWEVHRAEAAHLKSVTKERVMEAFDEWFLPGDDGDDDEGGGGGKPRERRRLLVYVIGTGVGPSSAGRPEFDPDVLDVEICNRIRAFHDFAGNALW